MGLIRKCAFNSPALGPAANYTAAPSPQVPGLAAWEEQSTKARALPILAIGKWVEMGLGGERVHRRVGEDGGTELETPPPSKIESIMS